MSETPDACLLAQTLAQTLAELHEACFDTPWSAEAFAGLLRQPGVALNGDDQGFILIRVAAGEAEILTLAVPPQARRAGRGRALVQTAIDQARALGAEKMLLEVAVDNTAALALYHGLGFETAGRRPRYYSRPDGALTDALIMSLMIPRA